MEFQVTRITILATVTLPQIVDDTNPIEFNVIAVDGWETVDAGTQKPTPQQ